VGGGVTVGENTATPERKKEGGSKKDWAFNTTVGEKLMLAYVN
jgi:hypothetical protein